MLGSGIGVWLEAKDKPVMWIFLCGCQCCADLGWMVSVVINDCDAVYLALVLETSVSTAKFVKACEDRLRI